MPVDLWPRLRAAIQEMRLDLAVTPHVVVKRESGTMQVDSFVLVARFQGKENEWSFAPIKGRHPTGDVILVTDRSGAENEAEWYDPVERFAARLEEAQAGSLGVAAMTESNRDSWSVDLRKFLGDRNYERLLAAADQDKSDAGAAKNARLTKEMNARSS
jgi:hypothetical protein